VKGAAASFRASYRGWLGRPRTALFPRGVRSPRIQSGRFGPGRFLPPDGYLARARRRLRQLGDRWRKSLQLRVITATLLLCAVVVTVLGYFLMQQVVADLYGDKQQSSVGIAQVGLSDARALGAFSSYPSASTRQALWKLANQLASKSGTPYAVYVTLRHKNQGPPAYTTGAEVGFASLNVALPGKLVKAVHDERPGGPLQREWASMAIAPNYKPVPGLVLGAPFGSVYQLYYFFPLSAEQQSIANVQRNLLLVGVAAVFLLAAIAWLVTRWVVIPVRLAARGARRLSAGKLNERMEVRGTDELAALASSFNEMAASLQEKLEELEDLSQVQRQFVSDVSHELRTPLTTIRIASDVLFAARDEMDSDAARSAELLQSQLERFESLLTDLLEISRFDANAATLDAEPVDVCTIVRQSADVAQQLAERRGTKIEFRLPADPCIAEVDRRRVERILRNLLLNAVEHGENKDTVVTAAIDSAAVAITVRDYGIGLAPGEEQLVFDRFWRADPARARTSGGTGLGLAIALEDARLHGGWLEAWGEPGRGSVFRLTLPRVASGELHGSPLALRPEQAGVDAAELPGLTDLGAAQSMPDVLAPGPPSRGPGVAGQPSPDGQAGRQPDGADADQPADEAVAHG
jgi:two-component system, OmpR family, sensor histidine kinase MtrB